MGVKSYKIEGRLKSPEYVAAVTAAYRKALDAACAGRAAVSDRGVLNGQTLCRGMAVSGGAFLFSAAGP